MDANDSPGKSDWSDLHAHIEAQRIDIYSEAELIRWLAGEDAPDVESVRYRPADPITGLGACWIYRDCGFDVEVDGVAPKLSFELRLKYGLERTEQIVPPEGDDTDKAIGHDEYLAEEYERLGIDPSDIDREIEHELRLLRNVEWKPSETQKWRMGLNASSLGWRFLTAEEVIRAYRANEFAAFIVRPLNVRIDTTWQLFGSETAEAVRASLGFHELFRKWCASVGIPAVYMDVLEVGAEKGLHSHFRAHLPIEFRAAFARWLPQALNTASSAADGRRPTKSKRRLNRRQPVVAEMGHKEVLAASRRRAAIPDKALHVTVKDPGDWFGIWQDFRYTMKALNPYEAAPVRLRHLGYALATAFRLKDPRTTLAPNLRRRIFISKPIGESAQRVLREDLIRLGYEEEDTESLIDRRPGAFAQLFSDDAWRRQRVWSTYDLRRLKL